jgi:hypothetical protein
MRRVYYQATKSEVDWYGKGLGIEIFGKPKTKRALDAHVIPRLCFVTQSKDHNRPIGI